MYAKQLTPIRRIHIIAGLLLLQLVACDSDHSYLIARAEHWRQTLASLPQGASREKVEAWGLEHNVHFIYQSQERQFYAVVERLPERGIKFPCSEWYIALQISMGESGTTEKNEVITSGVCT